MAQTTIAENLLRVNQRIAAAANRASRNAEEITLIGVSKTHPAEAIREAFDAGLRHFGENRVQEWEGKRAGLPNFLPRGTSSAICKATKLQKPQIYSTALTPWMILHWRKSWTAPLAARFYKESRSASS